MDSQNNVAVSKQETYTGFSTINEETLQELFTFTIMAYNGQSGFKAWNKKHSTVQLVKGEFDGTGLQGETNPFSSATNSYHLTVNGTDNMQAVFAEKLDQYLSTGRNGKQILVTSVQLEKTGQKILTVTCTFEESGDPIIITIGENLIRRIIKTGGNELFLI